VRVSAFNLGVTGVPPVDFGLMGNLGNKKGGGKGVGHRFGGGKGVGHRFD